MTKNQVFPKTTIFALVLAALMIFTCRPVQDQATTLSATELNTPTSTLTPSPGLTATTRATTPTQTRAPSQTTTLSPRLTATQTVLCGKPFPDNAVYIDQYPAFAIRQGPGCQYPEFPGEIIKPEPIMFFNILGSYQDWLLVDLCNDRQGWIFAPATDRSNLQFSLDQLPLITPQSPAVPSPTALPPDQADNQLHQAGETLVSFFELLYQQNYQEAVNLFGGGYGIVINWNPDVDPNDHAALLMRGCQFNGFECFLRVSKIVSAEQVSELEYHITVEFINPDGSIYQRRGINDTVMIQFLFRVVRDCNGKYLVADWPFYEQYGG